MNRGEIRAAIWDILRDPTGGTYKKAKVDRAINLVAQILHSKLMRGAGIRYGRGTFTFTANGKVVPLTGVNDYQQHEYLRRVSVPSIVPVIGCRAPLEEFGRIIVEWERQDSEYETGYDRHGRAVAFMRYDGAATPTYTLEFLTEQAGDWELVYARACANITPDSTPGDSERYPSLPGQYEGLLIYETANALLGPNQEGSLSMDIAETLGLLRMEFESTLSRGNVS